MNDTTQKQWILGNEHKHCPRCAELAESGWVEQSTECWHKWKNKQELGSQNFLEVDITNYQDNYE